MTTSSGGPSASPSESPEGETVTIGDREATRTELLGGPDWLTADDSYVYVKLDAAAIARLDPATGSVVASVEIGGDVCQGVGAGFDSLWACAGTGIARVDFDSAEVVTIDIIKAPGQGQLATGMGRVWVLVGGGDALVGIDPTTNQPGAPLALGLRCNELTVGANRVWVACANDDTVLEVDGAGHTVLRSITGIDEPRSISATDSAVWVGGVSETARIDPATGTVIARVPGGSGRFGSVYATEGDVWVRSDDRFLERVDPATNTQVEALPYDVESGGHVLVAHGAVWTSAYDDAAVIRIPLD